MDFSTSPFLFLLLPLSLLLYLIAPKRLKNTALLLVSLLFFSWGVPEYLVLLLCSIFFNYFTALELDAHRKSNHMRRARAVLIASVVVNVLLLGFFKYYGFLVENFNSIFGTHWEPRVLPAPIGLSFYTFTLLSYLFDVYRGKAPATRNILNFSLYVSFFPKLVSGPIVQYSDMEAQLRDHPFTWEKMGSGTRMFLIGLGKKMLLANFLSTVFSSITALPMSQVTFVTSWLGALSYSLMLYLDFSGYSDMAIGLSLMFGFEFKKNFDYPYLSNSITDFWRRWHISLGSWFKEYVYIPLGCSRVGTAKTIRNLLVVWFLTGIWHGANWTFLLWGLYHGLLLVLEKFVFRRLQEKLPGFFQHFFTLLLVIIGWVFFFSDSLPMAFGWLGRMIGLGGFFQKTDLYFLAGSWLILLVSILACFPVGATIGNNLMHRGNAWKPLSIVFFAAILILSLACMMNDTYTTFLYAQF